MLYLWSSSTDLGCDREMRVADESRQWVTFSDYKNEYLIPGTSVCGFRGENMSEINDDYSIDHYGQPWRVGTLPSCNVRSC